MKLFISGAGSFDTTRLTPSAEKVKKFLDGSKDGELFTSVQVANLNKMHLRTVFSMEGCLTGYHHLVVRQRYWGKPRTIKQLIKETK